MRARPLLEYVAFQVVWLACAFGAAGGSNVPGIASTFGLVAVHLSLSKSRAAAATMISVCGVIGFAAESLFAVSGVLRYEAAWPSASLAPAWMIALWMAFATTLPATRWVLGDRALAKAAVLGAVFGPAAYLAGDRIGALQVASPVWHGVLVAAAVWALAFPALIALSARMSYGGDRCLKT